MQTGTMRVTKRDWYDRYGGLTNSRCFRKADKRGTWRYYVIID